MRSIIGVASTLAALAVAAPLGAQDLASRVAAVRDGRVELAFTPREGVCGDGRRDRNLSTWLGSTITPTAVIHRWVLLCLSLPLLPKVRPAAAIALNFCP